MFLLLTKLFIWILFFIIPECHQSDNVSLVRESLHLFVSRVQLLELLGAIYPLTRVAMIKEKGKFVKATFPFIIVDHSQDVI